MGTIWDGLTSLGWSDVIWRHRFRRNVFYEDVRINDLKDCGFNVSRRKRHDHLSQKSTSPRVVRCLYDVILTSHSSVWRHTDVIWCHSPTFLFEWRPDDVIDKQTSETLTVKGATQNEVANQKIDPQGAGACVVSDRVSFCPTVHPPDIAHCFVFFLLYCAMCSASLNNTLRDSREHTHERITPYTCWIISKTRSEGDLLKEVKPGQFPKCQEHFNHYPRLRCCP